MTPANTLERPTTPELREANVAPNAAPSEVQTEMAIRLPRPTEHHLSLGDARSLVERDDRGKWDITVPRHELTLKNGELEFPIDLGPHDLAANGSSGDERTVSYDRLSPSSFALGQLCARLGVPAAYIRQCPPILQDQNINFWLKAGGGAKASVTPAQETGEEPDQEWKHLEWMTKQELRQRNEKWRLRARRDTLRAVLSERFSPLDNMKLLETLAPALPPHYKVQWIELDDESFHLRVIDPTKAREVLPGDEFFVGVHLANSEVGYRSLTVDALVYRLVCSNGLVALVKGKSLLRQRHIHVLEPRFKIALEEALEQALGATETLLNQLQIAATQIVPNAGTAIERLSHHWRLSESTQEIAKAALLTEPARVQESGYGLLNAFTAAAQSLEGEKRYDLEMLAGSLAQHGVPQFALSKREVEAEVRSEEREGSRCKAANRAALSLSGVDGQ